MIRTINNIDDKAHALRWLDSDERIARAAFDQEMRRIEKRREQLATMTFDEDGWRT